MSVHLPLFLAAGLLVAAEQPQAQQAKEDLAKTLLALEKESWELIKRRDLESIRRYATDDFLWLFWDGTRVRKDNLEAFLNRYELVSYTITESEVIRFDADAAVLVYRLTYTAAEKGKKPVQQTVWATSTYVRRGDAWKEILYQETAVKGP